MSNTVNQTAEAIEEAAKNICDSLDELRAELREMNAQLYELTSDTDTIKAAIVNYVMNKV
jgi:DNA integrity scanning protein DisA with diadenylate cyclase activity